MKSERGFTLIEVMVAILILTIGVLGLASTASSVTRMIAAGQRSAVAATFASQRLERLRASGCTSQTAGADTLKRGTTWVAINNWSFTNPGNSTWRVLLTSQYKTIKNQTRIDRVEITISCLI